MISMPEGHGGDEIDLRQNAADPGGNGEPRSKRRPSTVARPGRNPTPRHRDNRQQRPRHRGHERHVVGREKKMAVEISGQQAERQRDKTRPWSDGHASDGDDGGEPGEADNESQRVTHVETVGERETIAATAVTIWNHGP